MMRIRLVFIMVLMTGITGCGSEAVTASGGKELMTHTISMEKPDGNGVDLLNPVEGRELTATAGSEEEARDIAEKYGIELVDYGLGVAVFHTDEDPSAVIERGKKQGLPVLSKNTRSITFDDSGTSGDFSSGRDNVF